MYVVVKASLWDFIPKKRKKMLNLLHQVKEGCYNISQDLIAW